MPAIHKRSPKLRIEFVATQKHSVLGGLPAIEALPQEFDLWKKLRQRRGQSGRPFRSEAVFPLRSLRGLL